MLLRNNQFSGDETFLWEWLIHDCYITITIIFFYIQLNKILEAKGTKSEVYFL